ncbi:cyclin-a1-1 [Anaeramoeba flamelloides]|uniref:Cyclin-a1-1 n=1 Tax=Anaeramoeba flamelloides TaxID=1746091 RepID=A0AAV7YDS9_9EUKA|nr:cyclin-a1-1 [Anaeramoeba flamelloides]
MSSPNKNKNKNKHDQVHPSRDEQQIEISQSRKRDFSKIPQEETKQISSKAVQQREKNKRLNLSSIPKTKNKTKILKSKENQRKDKKSEQSKVNRTNTTPTFPCLKQISTKEIKNNYIKPLSSKGKEKAPLGNLDLKQKEKHKVKSNLTTRKNLLKNTKNFNNTDDKKENENKSRNNNSGIGLDSDSGNDSEIFNIKKKNTTHSHSKQKKETSLTSSSPTITTSESELESESESESELESELESESKSESSSETNTKTNSDSDSESESELESESESESESSSELETLTKRKSKISNKQPSIHNNAININNNNSNQESECKQNLSDLYLKLIDDPNFYSEYGNDYINSLLNTKNYYPEVDYLKKKQPFITTEMRTVLIRWLNEVCQEYQLQPETLHLAINYLDRFLSKVRVQRRFLQLVGVTALFLASKLEENTPPTIDDFSYITKNTYQNSHILQCENQIINILQFHFRVLTPIPFLKYFLLLTKANKKTKLLAYYLSEVQVPHLEFLKFKPEMIAISSIALAHLILSNIQLAEWDLMLKNFPQFHLNNLKTCILSLTQLYKKILELKTCPIFEKFNQNDFMNVSSIKILKNYI